MTTVAAAAAVLLPDDEHNRALASHVHPPDWVNPQPSGRYNLVVIGAGTAGLVSAVGAAGLGAKVALVERHLLGGDCLNYGCVPSKALIRAARAAADARNASTFGVRGADDAVVDFGRVMERMRSLRAGIAPNDSVARLVGLGIDVFLGQARFTSGDAIDVDGRTLRFSRAVVATGARAAAPPIPGLADVDYLTNETVFSLTALPRHLVVIGAGPIGCELAQAFARFGAEVTLVSDSPMVMPREDPDAAAVVQAALERDGISLVLDAKVTRVASGRDGEKVVHVEREGREGRVAGDAVLVAVGRAPNIDGLDLQAAGITADRSGVTVDDHLRTTNRRVFAAGDIASRFKFTHAADAMARIVIQNALFFGRKKASALVIPWATYTDPEVAHVGLTADEAAKRPDVRTLTVPFPDVDRAILDGATEGFARVHADPKGRIVGATIVAPHAGEMIGEMSLAMTAGVSLGTLAGTIHPYPTQSEAWKKLGDQWNRGRLTPRVRSLFGTLMRWRR
jgi:pyruvate/2-oxoglutarate dehydrogenase complex dihydrolipoamide dehydrogenase (E3) component